MVVAHVFEFSEDGGGTYSLPSSSHCMYFISLFCGLLLIPPSLSFLSLHLYIDINECTESKESLCFTNADCVNNVGSYNCVCRAGYVENGTFCMSKSFGHRALNLI